MAPLLSGLLHRALELPSAERYRLAFLIAESLGYALRSSKVLERIMSDDNTCPCGRPVAECVLPHCPGKPTEPGISEAYLEMMQAHIDDDGKLSHLNGLDLLKEVYRLRRLLGRAASSVTSQQAGLRR